MTRTIRRDLAGEVRDVIDTYGVWDMAFIMDSLLYDGKPESFERALMRCGDDGKALLRRLKGWRSREEKALYADPVSRQKWQAAETRRKARRAATADEEAA